jgi:DNA-3-methyladenine glycosylase I
MADNVVERCRWAESSVLMMEYHDKEWGVPVHDDRKLFEFLVLDGAQAGLSWETVLRKRENYRLAFHSFDAARIAQYAEDDIARLLADPGIIRNRRKIVATIENARRFLEVQAEFGTFDRYIWQFVGGKAIKNQFQSLAEIPAKTGEAELMSKDLQKRGFRFVGPTICYAFMQAAGLVNDHLVTCFRYSEL